MSHILSQTRKIINPLRFATFEKIVIFKIKCLNQYAIVYSESTNPPEWLPSP
jgi:hypothetical protein